LLFLMPLSAPAPLVQDPDLWWHLRAADWMFDHHNVPVTDSFSRTACGTPWADYSWLAELTMGAAYRGLGLPGVVLWTTALSLAVGVAVCVLVRGLQKNLTISFVLVVVAVMGLDPLLMPRPWMFSILLFLVELHLLLNAQQTCRPRLLWWLPPLFCLWANLHIQFTVGLLVLALAVVEPWLAARLPQGWVDRRSATISWRYLAAVFGLSLAATLLNPYHVQVYGVALETLGQKEMWNVISELTAVSFRSLADWVMLGATLAAAAAIGTRRPLRLLLLMLFPLMAFLSFRSGRDLWLVLIVAVAILASASRGLPLPPSPLSRRDLRVMAGLLTAALATVSAAVVAGGVPSIRQDRLTAYVAETYPAAAVEHVHRHVYPGPLFNTFDWGGYLIYALPDYPVSMDGRLVVHGTQRVLRHCRTQRAKDGWRDDPDLAAANLVLVSRELGLASVLRLDAAFTLVYEDKLAAVFVRRQPVGTAVKDAKSGPSPASSTGPFASYD
jgi:hypothetical protein